MSSHSAGFFSASLYSSDGCPTECVNILLVLHRTHVLSFPCFCLQLGRGRGWPHHQRTDWMKPQKPRPISQREWTLLITPINWPRFCSSGILSASIFGQWGLFHSTPAVSTHRIIAMANRPIYRLVGPLLYTTHVTCLYGGRLFSSAYWNRSSLKNFGNT